MALPVDAVQAPVSRSTEATGRASGGAQGFGDALHRLLKAADDSSGEANRAVADMIAGTGDVHDAMIALQRAETTLELTIQLRNKLVQAYQDIMRMPV